MSDFAEKLRSINFAGKAKSKTRIDVHDHHTVAVTESDNRQDVAVRLQRPVSRKDKP